MVPNWIRGCLSVISSRPTNPGVSIRTYIRVKSGWCSLYRAIDSAGATIDFLLSALRDADAAKRLFRKAPSLIPPIRSLVSLIQTWHRSTARPFPTYPRRDTCAAAAVTDPYSN